jgi:excisionase family DNA binding protein
MITTSGGAGSLSSRTVCRYGKFGRTKAYELIAHERIRAYKMGGKTMIDLDSVDEYHTSLPRVETVAS